MPALEIFLLVFIFFCIAAGLVWALRDNRRLQKELKQTDLERVKSATALENYEKNSDFLQTEFKNIAQEIFDKKNESLIQNNKQQVNGLLNPLKENIQSFQKDFIHNKASTEEQIKQLINLGKDTKNLNQALTKQPKTQGYLGEITLLRILEDSGLTRDREYNYQKKFKDKDGKVLQPDVVINLPRDRKIIVDSKISLTPFIRYMNATDEQQKEFELKDTIDSVKKHLQDLEYKGYHNIAEIKSLDLTLMFIPIEAVSSLIFQKSKSLFQTALRKKIMLVSPFTLMAIIQSIHSIWKLEKQSKNAEQIALEAGKMYDKFVAFHEDFLKIGKKLDDSKTSYNDANKRLSEGQGNIIQKIEDIRELGIQNKKQLPNKSIASDPEKKIEELENP